MEIEETGTANPLENYRRQILDFYQNNQLYYDSIERIIEQKSTRLNLNLDHLRETQEGQQIAATLLKYPDKAIKFMEQLLKEVITDRDHNHKMSEVKVRLGFEGQFGKHMVSTRGLNTFLLNKMVQVEGIVTKQSIVRPKLVKSVHYCEQTRTGFVKHYTDILEDEGEKTEGNNAFPMKDQEGNSLQVEYGLCEFKNNQTLVLQEIPESCPTGQLPRSVEVILEDDLVDTIKPGDRVLVAGQFKSFASLQMIAHKAIFRTILKANSVKSLQQEAKIPNMVYEDIQQIRQLAQDFQGQILDLLGNSLQPSVLGHSDVKKALILQLLSGQEMTLQNGTHLRGDINILLIGDPGVAKSQMLRGILNLAPLAINTTGRGTTGVGLTAAVIIDKDTGQRNLEAGAMVLADRGIVCIDEFDKMSIQDRVTIHEVMEQQTVTIAKAGIHTQLNARCSVLAAANPINGDYNPKFSIHKNINLPDSLLSRFDLLFILLDERTEQNDLRIARRVIKNHCYVREGEYLNKDANAYLYRENQNNVNQQNSIFEQRFSDSNQVLTQTFLQKYIHYAKKTCNPKLNEDAGIFLRDQ